MTANWIFHHKPHPSARPGLFRFPHAGGGASARRDWAVTEALTP